MRMELRADGIAERDVRDDPAAEERSRPRDGAVDELVDQHQVSGSDLFPHRPDGAHRDEPRHAQLLHAEDVGARVHLGGREAVSLPVPRQEDHLLLAELSQEVLVAGLAEWRADALAAHAGQPRQVVQPRPADHPDDGPRHGRALSHTTAVPVNSVEIERRHETRSGSETSNRFVDCLASTR
jgi:hypothetical protein